MSMQCFPGGLGSRYLELPVGRTQRTEEGSEGSHSRDCFNDIEVTLATGHTNQGHAYNELT